MRREHSPTVNNPFAVAQKYLDQNEQTQAAPVGVDTLIEGEITAVLIDSPIVGPVWFASDDGFKSGDDIPVFFASELPFLRKMGETELRRRYEQKLALGGGWIRSRTDEPTKH